MKKLLLLACVSAFVCTQETQAGAGRATTMKRQPLGTSQTANQTVAGASAAGTTILKPANPEKQILSGATRPTLSATQSDVSRLLFEAKNLSEQLLAMVTGDSDTSDTSWLTDIDPFALQQMGKDYDSGNSDTDLHPLFDPNFVGSNDYSDNSDTSYDSVSASLAKAQDGDIQNYYRLALQRLSAAQTLKASKEATAELKIIEKELNKRRIDPASLQAEAIAMGTVKITQSDDNWDPFAYDPSIGVGAQRFSNSELQFADDQSINALKDAMGESSILTSAVQKSTPVTTMRQDMLRLLNRKSSDELRSLLDGLRADKSGNPRITPSIQAIESILAQRGVTPSTSGSIQTVSV